MIAGLLNWMIPKSMKQKPLDHARYSAVQAAKRLAMHTDRTDFILYMLKFNEDEDVSRRDQGDYWHSDH